LHARRIMKVLAVGFCTLHCLSFKKTATFLLVQD
jgi:hypothetical protein